MVTQTRDLTDIDLTRSSMTSVINPIWSPCLFLISPIMVCLACHIIQALVLLPTRSCCSICIFHMAQLTVFFFLATGVFVCLFFYLLYQYATSACFPVCSFSLANAALPFRGRPTWDHKYQICLRLTIRDQEGSKQECSEMIDTTHFWNIQTTNCLRQSCQLGFKTSVWVI